MDKKSKIDKVDLSNHGQFIQTIVPRIIDCLLICSIVAFAITLHLHFFHAFFSVIVLSIGIACLLGAILLEVFNYRNFNTSKVSMLSRITALEQAIGG
jgi:hypothetical protein